MSVDDVRHDYLISRDGVFKGLLPNVDSPFETIQNINTAGVELTIKLAYSPIEAVSVTPKIIGEADSLVRNGNDLEVIEYSRYYPNGKTVFSGFIQKNKPVYGGSNDITITAISYGDDMDNILLQASTTLDQSQATQDSSFGFGSDAATYKSFIQSFQTGSGVTSIASIDLTLKRDTANSAGGDVYVAIYPTEADAKASTNVMAYATNTSVQFDTSGVATVFNFAFSGALTVSALTTYWMKVGATAEYISSGTSLAPYLIYYKNSNAYANGSLNVENNGLANTGFLHPASNGAVLNEWTNPTNAYSSNNVYATRALTNSLDTYRQDFYNFGFSVPSDTSVSGFELKVEGNYTTTGTRTALSSGNRTYLGGVSLGGGFQGGQNLNLTTDTTLTFGGPTTLPNTIPTPAEVNDNSTAGIAIVPGVRGSTGSGTATARIDDIQVKVYYSTWTTPTADLYFKTYRGGGVTTVIYSGEEVTDIVKSATDNYVAQGGAANYNGTSTDNTGNTIDYTFKLNTMLEVVKKMLEYAPPGFFWYVDPATQILYFKDTEVTATHTLVLGKHITQLELESTIENIRNVVAFTGGDTGGGTNFIELFTNPTSIAEIGHQYLERIGDSNVVDSTNAAVAANSFLDGHDAETYQSPITIPASVYDLTLFNPGDTIGFAGFGNFVDDLILQIASVKKNRFFAALTVGQLPDRITNQIDTLKRNIGQIQNIDTP